MVGKWTWCWAALALLVLLCAWLLRSTPEVQVPWSDAGFYYEGRWEENEADWPCTAVRFELEATAPVALVFSTGPMSRFNVSVIGPSGHHWQLWSSWLPGPASLPISEGGARASAVAGPPHPLRVELRKLGTSHPLGTGLGNRIATSRWAFHGLSHGPEVQLKLLRPQTPQRRIEFLGAADALGMEPLHPPEPPRALLGVAGLRHLATAATAWQRQSCQAAYPGLIAEKLQAEYHVQALAGVGVVQNAFHQVAEYVLGIPTWHHYYGRLCASRPAPPASSPRVRRKPAQLVVVHLGSDDFRGSVVPENNTFRVIYNKLLRSVIHFHGGYRQNLSLLALGSTNAAEHVEDAVRYFHETLDLYTDNTSVRVKYLQVHSSDALELAQEVLPTLRSFMGW